MFAVVARPYSTLWIRRLGATFVCVLLILMATPSPAAAEMSPPLLADISLSALTVNPQTGLGHFSVSVTCLVPLGFVRSKTTLVQTYGEGRFAASFNVNGAFGCAASQRLEIPMQFGGQQAASFLGRRGYWALPRSWRNSACISPSELCSFIPSTS